MGCTGRVMDLWSCGWLSVEVYKTPFAELGKIWTSGIMTYGNERVGPASYEPP